MVDRSIQDVFEARARALARRPAENETSNTNPVVALTVAGERYGVDARYVVEVGLADGITPVPGLPSVWAGLVNVRGSVWPVLDLQNYLGVPASDASPHAPSLVFVSQDGVTIGLLSDTAPEFCHIATGSLRAPVDTGGGNAVVGVTPDFLSILDVDQLLTDTRLVMSPIGG